VTHGQIGSFVALLAACVLLILLVILGVPSIARLQFRYRLESIRDDGVDAIIGGEIRQGPAVTRFLAAVGRASRYPGWMSIARNYAVWRALRDVGVDPRQVAARPGYSDLRVSEQRLMDGLEARLRAAIRSYLIWGSPLGWACGLALLVLGRQPGSKLARTDRALPELARKSVSSDQGGSPKGSHQVPDSLVPDAALCMFPRR
jgi:hypothetical protein